MKYTGVTSRGIIMPIFKQGDDIVNMICDNLLLAADNEGFKIKNGDILGMTEAIVARTQGNYATTAQIASDLKEKFGGEDLGIIFPILSRNRFAILLRAMAQSTKKLYVMLSYPSDEVGNALITLDMLDEANVDPYRDSFTEAEFRNIFGNNTVHTFTGVDYIEYYKSLGANIEIVFSNNPKDILKYTNNVLNCDIHSRTRTKRILKNAGANVFSMDDILTQPVDGSGYNEQYGILGSNKATEEKVKLFPRDCQKYVDGVKNEIKNRTGKDIEVLIYGDGGFKDPVGGIWELADPVVSPAYTVGLSGTPNEIKIKYLADNEFENLSGDELSQALKNSIKSKENSLVGNMTAEGTTPRQLTDLVGSLCDLTSGSGDRGTPVVYIQGYFTNFASDEE